MKRVFYRALFVAIGTLGSALAASEAGGVDPNAEPLRKSLDLDGEEREYYVRLPRGYVPDKTYSLVSTVHGGRGNGRDHFLARGVREAADRAGFAALVVSPSFSNADPQASRFPTLGEGRFLRAVLTDVSRSYKVHPRMFLTGYSRGGQFAHRFALRQPELVRAVAPFAAGTWTTPGGELLIEGIGEVGSPRSFLANKKNDLPFGSFQRDSPQTHS